MHLEMYTHFDAFILSGALTRLGVLIRLVAFTRLGTFKLLVTYTFRNAYVHIHA